MTTLGDLQRRLQTALLGNDYPDGLLAGAHAEARFAIYATAYRARLLGALRDNYPVLHAVISDEAFDALALEFIAAHPSMHPSIRWFGEHLHAFVSADPDRLSHPALGDLIRMEWALRKAFDAANESTVRGEDLAAVAAEDWPALRFRAHPSVSLLAMDWAIEPLWRQLQDGSDADAEPPDESAHTLLIWRDGLETRFRTLDAPEAAFVAVLITGQTFSDACDAAAPYLPEDSATLSVTTYLQACIRDGVLCPAQGA